MGVGGHTHTKDLFQLSISFICVLNLLYPKPNGHHPIPLFSFSIRVCLLVHYLVQQLVCPFKGIKSARTHLLTPNKDANVKLSTTWSKHVFMLKPCLYISDPHPSHPWPKFIQQRGSGAVYLECYPECYPEDYLERAIISLLWLSEHKINPIS